MSSILKSNALINSIKRRAFIPKSQETFSNEDFLEMATEEINISLMDQLITARGDYLVVSEDSTIVEGVFSYPIPDRAVANKLRDVAIVAENGTVIYELSQISLEELSDYRNTYTYSNNAGNTFYVQDNNIVLNFQTLSPQYTLRMYFYIRPNKLVTDDKGATINSISTALEVNNINPRIGNISSISVESPTVITSAAHGLASGDTIRISGSNSTPSINGDYIITVSGTNTFSIPVSVTAPGTTGNWVKLLNTTVLTFSTIPKAFTSQLKYDAIGAKSPNKLKQYNLSANSINLTTNNLSFPSGSLEGVIVGDYINLAEETIVPNIPTELHPIVAQRVAVACLEAMGDEQNKQSAERKLAQMERSSLRMLVNRVEGAPKKITNRHGTLKQGNRTRRGGW